MNHFGTWGQSVVLFHLHVCPGYSARQFRFSCNKRWKEISSLKTMKISFKTNKHSKWFFLLDLVIVLSLAATVRKLWYTGCDGAIASEECHASDAPDVNHMAKPEQPKPKLKPKFRVGEVVEHYSESTDIYATLGIVDRVHIDDAQASVKYNIREWDSGRMYILVPSSSLHAYKEYDAGTLAMCIDSSTAGKAKLYHVPCTVASQAREELHYNVAKVIDGVRTTSTTHASKVRRILHPAEVDKSPWEAKPVAEEKQHLEIGNLVEAYVQYVDGRIFAIPVQIEYYKRTRSYEKYDLRNFLTGEIFEAVDPKHIHAYEPYEYGAMALCHFEEGGKGAPCIIMSHTRRDAFSIRYEVSYEKNGGSMEWVQGYLPHTRVQRLLDPMYEVPLEDLAKVYLKDFPSGRLG